MNACRLWLGICGALLLQGQILLGAAPALQEEVKPASEHKKRDYEMAVLRARTARDALVQNFLGGAENMAALERVQTGQDSTNLLNTLNTAINSYNNLEIKFQNWRTILGLKEGIYTEEELRVMNQVREKLLRLSASKSALSKISPKQKRGASAKPAGGKPKKKTFDLDRKIQQAYDSAVSAKRDLAKVNFNQPVATLQVKQLNLNNPIDNVVYQAVDKALSSYEELEKLIAGNWTGRQPLYTNQELSIMREVRGPVAPELPGQMEEEEEKMGAEAGDEPENGGDGGGKYDVAQQAVELMKNLRAFIENNIPDIETKLFDSGEDITRADLHKVSLENLNQFGKLLRAVNKASPGQTWIEKTLATVQEEIREEFVLLERQLHFLLSVEVRKAYEANDTSNILSLINSMIQGMTWKERLDLVRVIKQLLSIDEKLMPQLRDKRNIFSQVRQDILWVVAPEIEQIKAQVQKKYQGKLPSLFNIQQLDVFEKADLYADLQRLSYGYDIFLEFGRTLVMPFKALDGSAISKDEVDTAGTVLQKNLKAHIKQIEAVQQFNFDDLANITPKALKQQVDSLLEELSSLDGQFSVHTNMALLEKRVEGKSDQFLQNLEAILAEGLRLSYYGSTFDTVGYVKMLIWFYEALKITQGLLGENAQQVRMKPGAQPQAAPGAAAPRPQVQPLPGPLPGKAAAQRPPGQALPGGAAPGRPMALPIPGDGGPAARPGQAGPAMPGLPPLVTPAPLPHATSHAAPGVVVRPTPTSNAQKIRNVVEKLKKIIEEKNEVVQQQGQWNITAKTERLKELQKQAVKLEQERVRLQREKDAAFEFTQKTNVITQSVITMYPDFLTIVKDVERLPELSTLQRAWRWLGSLFGWPWRR